MTDEANPRSLPFTVDARIIAQLGEQLVPSDVMALAELVKNSFDADASVVSIAYSGESGSQELVVEDDGDGMTLDQLRDGWMHIGTAEKERNQFSPRYGRPRAGVKGIGRFAAQRLGDRLRLQTTPRGSGRRYSINFDWTNFSAGCPLDSILHNVREEGAELATHGTRLSIVGLKRIWTREDMAGVIKDLSSVHSPLATPAQADDGRETDPGFEVAAQLQSSQGTEVIDELDVLREERVMHLKGEVDAEGRGHFMLSFFRPEREPKKASFKGRLQTGALSFDVDLFIFSSRWVEELGVRTAQGIARKHGGVRMWRDGFRVFPFGEPFDDWLGLEEHIAARRQPLNLWRNQQILGGVRIGRTTNPELQDLLTRRGMIETTAYHDLRSFVLEGLIIAANEHASLSARKTRSGRRQPKPSDALKAALGVLVRPGGGCSSSGTGHSEEIAKGTAAEGGGASRAGVAPEVADELVRTVRRAEDELLTENQMLKVLASLGTGVAVFAHEMKTVSLEVAVSAAELDRVSAELPVAMAPRLRSEARRLRSGIESLTTYARYVEDFVSEDARTRRAKMELSEFLGGFFSVFQPLLDRRGITSQVDVPRGLWTCPMFKAELISICFNLMTNAVKALLTAEVDERRVGVLGSRQGDEIVAVFADTGCGIPEDIVQEIFDPFVTRSHTPGDSSLGRGTGLGLYIVREIVKDYGGEISVCPVPKGYKTGFEVRLPAGRLS